MCAKRPAAPTAVELARDYGQQIAQVVRGDRTRLSEGECAEVLHSQISYYANDLAVIGWNAAFLYDSSAGAETAIQLLEYANSQLLEFRHYDELLTGILDSVYDTLGKKRSRLARWRLARSATSLHTVLLEVSELTEHADNAIKFLSDMFAARLYRLAAAKVGVPDYQEPGGAEAQDRGRSLRLYGRSVQSEPRLFSGSDCGTDPADRTLLCVSGEANIDFAAGQ